MRRYTTASRNGVTRTRQGVYGVARRLCVTSLCYVVCATSLASQRPAPFDQQLRDNQRRLEDIRRERTQVEQELEPLRTQAHSLSDELANLERQKETTNRIVNELDRQISGLSVQIDKTTVDLLLAQDALEEKRAVLERRLVDIYKRGPLYAYQVLFTAASFGDLLSRYKYLYLVSRQDRLLANDMSKLQRRSARRWSTHATPWAAARTSGPTSCSATSRSSARARPRSRRPVAARGKRRSACRSWSATRKD